MADVNAALGALDRIEGILRRRYHYPHPIFEHVAAARAALEEPDVAPVVHPEQPVSTKPEAETVTTVASTADATPEPKSGTEGPTEKPKARRTRKARR